MAILSYNECRELASKAVCEAVAKGEDYTAEDVHPNQVPLAIDLVTFVIYLRNNTDYFSGPDLDIHFPEATSEDFLAVLGQNALHYTGE